MVTLTRFMGGAQYKSFAGGVTTYALVAPDAGGMRFLSLDPTEAVFSAVLPWTNTQSGQAYSVVNQQRNTGDDIYLIHNMGSGTINVVRRDGTGIVAIAAGEGAKVRLLSRDPSYYGAWLTEKRTLL